MNQAQEQTKQGITREQFLAGAWFQVYRGGSFAFRREINEERTDDALGWIAEIYTRDLLRPHGILTEYHAGIDRVTRDGFSVSTFVMGRIVRRRIRFAEVFLYEPKPVADEISH